LCILELYQCVYKSYFSRRVSICCQETALPLLRSQNEGDTSEVSTLKYNVPLIITRITATRTMFCRRHNEIQKIFFIQRPCPLSGYYYLHVPSSHFSLVRVIARFSHRDGTPAFSREYTLDVDAVADRDSN